ncbi:MAG TPA: hypothetical protein VF660_03545 [Actinomycetota bacterium]
MGRYIVLNTHAPEECEAMEADIGKIPPELEGKDFMCTCPAGEHAYYMIVQGETAEQVLDYFPPSFRLGRTRAVPLEVMKF